MSLKNVLLLKKYSFVRQSANTGLSLTPLSQQIKQNIAFEWIKSLRLLPAVEVFVEPFITHTEPLTAGNHRQQWLKSILDNYNGYYGPWSAGITETVGVVQRFVCLKKDSQPKPLKTFFEHKVSDCLVFALFCQKQQSLYWFQKLQGSHYQWFRNLSKSPLKSRFSMNLEENNAQKCHINYKIDESIEEIETIEHISGSSITTTHPTITDLDIISCQINLDNSLVALLNDAFTTKQYKNGKSVKKMKLHLSLAPFKVGFTYRDSVIIDDVLLDLTKHLIQSLKLFDIPVLPFTPNNLVSIDSYDELGVPYVVILDNDSTRMGVVGLKNRDSDLEESVHISKLQLTLCLYLNVIHPSKIRNKY